MQKGDIVGHEFMGEVVEVGPGVTNLKPGDRVVVPFTICCGDCEQCRRGNWSVCERTNRKKDLGDLTFGHTTAGLFGYTHLTGGYAGGQAEYVRVPYADVAPVKIPDGLTDEQVLFLGDIFPTGWQAAAQCDIQPTDTVAVWGAGPVGQFAIRSAFLLGAERVIAIDRFPERLRMARSKSGAETINYEETDVYETLMEMTGGIGPDACIDAVGMEAHMPGMAGAYDRVKQAMMMETDRPHALREAIMCCRNGGIISVIGVYGGFIDKFPIGSVMQRALTIKTGQAHVHRYMRPLLERIENGDIDPSFVVTHTMSLDDAPYAFDIFKNKDDKCIKVVLKPDWNGNGAAKDDSYTVIH
jgi:threonine dehydrogenase-like Zn-dependent dehydrogenase